MLSIIRLGCSLAVILLLGCCHAKDSNKAAMLAAAHFTQHGVRLPTREFTAALRAAAVDISHLSCRKSLVLLAMANEDALAHTVPLFLLSMSRVLIQGGRHAGERLDARLVLVAWSAEALEMCRALQKDYRHQCVRDAEHAAATGLFGFHSEGFNALGFAKMKYILNGLSAGHDVVFLDADIVVLQDPLPYLLTRGSDMTVAMENCMVYNDSLAFHSPEFLAMERRTPPINIGVLYFKATAGVTRCMYNWAWDMHMEVQWRPQVWDQDVYGKIMLRCAATNKLHWQVLDPRLFQSACFDGCGCTFTDDQVMTRKHVGRPGQSHPFLDGTSTGGSAFDCGPQHWTGWLMRHFPCSRLAKDKGEYMRNLLDGYYGNHSARITMRT